MNARRNTTAKNPTEKRKIICKTKIKNASHHNIFLLQKFANIAMQAKKVKRKKNQPQSMSLRWFYLEKKRNGRI